jgi:hypothetical protein
MCSIGRIYIYVDIIYLILLKELHIDMRVVTIEIEKTRRSTISRLLLCILIKDANQLFHSKPIVCLSSFRACENSSII